jgi:hypothetical protein
MLGFNFYRPRRPLGRIEVQLYSVFKISVLEGGEGVSVTPRPLLTTEKDTVPIVPEAEWTPGPVWTGAENLASIRIRSPDCPARSQSIYALIYPAHLNNILSCKNVSVHEIIKIF